MRRTAGPNCLQIVSHSLFAEIYTQYRHFRRSLLESKVTVSLFVAHDNPGAALVYSRVGFVGLSPQEGSVPGVDNWTEIGFDRSVVRLGHW